MRIFPVLQRTSLLWAEKENNFIRPIQLLYFRKYCGPVVDGVSWKMKDILPSKSHYFYMYVKVGYRKIRIFPVLQQNLRQPSSKLIYTGDYRRCASLWQYSGPTSMSILGLCCKSVGLTITYCQMTSLYCMRIDTLPCNWKDSCNHR